MLLNSIDGQVVYLDGETGVIKKIKEVINAVAKDFCYIGFLLWEVKEYEYYREKGYASVFDYAEQELNFKKRSTYNFINIAETFNTKSGSGAPTMHLDPKYRQYGYTQLTEMLALSDKQKQLIDPGMTIKEIRQVKKEEKSNLIDINYPKRLNDDPGAEECFTPLSEEISVNFYDKEKEVEEIAVDCKINYTRIAQLEIINLNNIINNLKSQRKSNIESLLIKDKRISELSALNDSLTVKVDYLEKNNNWSDVLRSIDSNFKKVTKQQIRNCIADYISSGEISFNQD